MQIVWLKRDLRVSDHEPLRRACKGPGPVLLLYVMEPSVWQAGDLSRRHAQFVLESLVELQADVRRRGGELVTMNGDMEDVLPELEEAYGPFTLYAHEEHGTPWTYSRDRRVHAWMKEREYLFLEYPPFGVTRRLQDRTTFDEHWEALMRRPQLDPPHRMQAPDVLPPEASTDVYAIKKVDVPGEVIRFGQQGGESLAEETLDSFLRERWPVYLKHIAKPQQAAFSSSRLSPYLAWGNISLRRVYQAAKAAGDARAMRAFRSRLHWHCHFIQRLEDEPAIAEKTMNPAFDDVREPWDEDAYQRWLDGRTGFPMIDAAMRSLRKTGWIPFRSRAMLVSFVCNTLLLDWRRPAQDLARLFLDYEPGIHFSQMQMQAGTTGFNTIRIYNPVKQGKDQDPDAAFIRRWVKELQHVPDAFVHEPWKDPHFFHRNYPGPVVDLVKANRRARAVLWETKASSAAQKTAGEQLEKHGSRRRRQEQKAEKPSSEQLSLFDQPPE
ncbi:FAD-binding domain-containing protein [Alkalicoccus chagannorensis]|uniref:FAD-binding domain-containing protein n=1 Tax=Alkalicoccus chagannorensis TaxID=427072 RepID=UPI0006842B96|nr:deoxyribodipyrimidine photo-lyase [Alkalicoccus chagannorensis]